MKKLRTGLIVMGLGVALIGTSGLVDALAATQPWVPFAICFSGLGIFIKGVYLLGSFFTGELKNSTA